MYKFIISMMVVDDNDDNAVQVDDTDGTIVLAGGNWFGNVTRVVNSLIINMPIVNRNLPLPFQRLVWDEYCARF